jgi:hypothetical protein
MLSVMLALVLQPVEPPADSPRGTPPLIVRAEVDSAGDLVSKEQQIKYVPETRTRKVIIMGKEALQSYTVSVPVMTVHVRKWALEKATITEAGGKKIDRKELARRLERPAAVVVSADGKAIDAGYLKLFKKETLVIVAPLAKPIPVEPMK